MKNFLLNAQKKIWGIQFTVLFNVYVTFDWSSLSTRAKLSNKFIFQAQTWVTF